MADSQALLASLLLGQRRRADPLESQRKYGETQMTAGADVSPVYSPWQGIARALQGGLGGLVAGQADAEQKTQDAATVGSLTKAAQATTPQDIAKALEGLKGSNADTVIPVLGQIIQSRLDQAITQQKAGTALSPYNIGPGGTPGGQGNGGTSITITPGQQQPGTVPQPPSGGADNNIMNIRQSSIPWQGKGAPQNGFETFATPQAGANATVQNFAAYVKENPNITVAQAIAKWAPASENNTAGYISRVSETTGINPGMRLADVMQNPVDMARLMEAGTGVEKGRMPAGVTPDVLVNASGAGQPQQAPQQQPQMAQAQPQGQPAPQQGSPAGGQLRQQAQRAMAMGDNVTALKFAQQATEEDAKWATEQGKIQLQGQEHDRQQQTATPNNEQALSYGYANRMLNSNQVIDKVGTALGNFKDRTVDSKVLGVGVPNSNYLVSSEYQQARQARDDFINAELRRESGSAINADEYEKADKQYFPVPGDKPETLALKARNRALVVEAMQRNAGPTYQPSPLIGAPAPAQQQGGGGDQVSGAPKPGVVEQGYRFKGGNPADKSNWERAQ